MTKIECNRCGVCCSICTCSFGKEDEFGICIHLEYIKDKNIYSCGKLVRKEIKKNMIAIGKGCMLKGVPDVYNHYRVQTDMKREYMADKRAQQT